MTQVQAQALQVVRPKVSTRILAEAARLVALSSVLYYLKLYTFPQGGSITLGGMIPVLLFALRRGPRLGIMAGAIFGFVVLYQEPVIYNPVQVLLDYPLAFGALGLAGFFSKYPIVGVGAGIFGRFVAHFFSGVIFFTSFAPPGTPVTVYSAIYNGSYLSVELIVSAAVMFMLLKRRILKIYL